MRMRVSSPEDQVMKKPTAKHPRKPVAHPYARISDPDQRKGGGLERQTTANLAEFARLFGFDLSKRVLVDDGVSAWKGLNASPEHQLGQFLADARKGLIPPGDCLLLENYDRLSRQNPWAAIGLVNELRQLGIHVGRLDRMKLLRYDSDGPGDFFEAAIEFMRGNSESGAKSMRNGSAWARKRKAARESGQLITHRLPAWVQEQGGKLRLVLDRAAAIKRMFHLSAGGYGAALIVKRLTEEGVPAFGASGRWTRAYVGLILKDRRVLQAAALSGVNANTLHSWDKSGFFTPSVSGSSGRGSRRRYSFQDLVALKVVKGLRDAGLSLQALRRVLDYLSNHSKQVARPLAELYLATDGKDCYLRDGKGLLSCLRQRGQRLLPFHVVDVAQTVIAMREAARGQEAPGPTADAV
jgi:DNA-binding transcriptional MerR regulator